MRKKKGGEGRTVGREKKEKGNREEREQADKPSKEKKGKEKWERRKRERVEWGNKISKKELKINKNIRRVVL